MAKVSIIIPTYNASKYLSRCLDSIQKQTLEDIKVILIDDKSSDNSLELAQDYQRRNPKRIEIIQNRENLGAGASRNRGLAKADSEYVSFIDSDDYIHPKMLESLYTSCKETNLDIARGNRKIVFHNLNVSALGRNGNVRVRKIIIPKEEVGYLSQEYPAVTNKLFRRDLIGDRRFPEDLKWEDYPFCIPLLYKANGVIAVPEAEYYYNVNLSGTTVTDFRSITPRLLDIFKCSDQIKEELITESSSKDLIEECNFLAVQNTLQRVRDILYSNLPYEKKKELISLISALMRKKYGPWQESSKYQEFKNSKIAYRQRMNLVEKLFLDPSYEEMEEKEIQKSIQKIIKK